MKSGINQPASGLAKEIGKLKRLNGISLYERTVIAKMKTKLQLILIFFILCPLILAAEDEVLFKATTKQIVELGEQFRVVYELNAEGSNFSGPKFNGLRVLSGPMTSSSSSIQIINGQMSRTFNQTYTYVVVASQEGDINLDAATVTVDGKQYQSNTLSIKVQAAGTQSPSATQPGQQQQHTDAGLTDKDLFLRAIVDKTNPALGEQIIVTYRLFTKVPVSSISVNKLSSFPGFWVKNLLDEGAPLKQSTQIIDGEEYVVADIRKMALFPQRTGKITIEPMELEGTAQIRVQADRRRPRDPFESFFNDPFFNRNIRNIQKTLVSNALEIDIKSLPFSGRPQDFAGAVGQFNIRSAIDKELLKTNEALTLSYTINGSGNIELIDLLQPSLPPDFEVFEPKVTTQAQTSSSGVSGTRTIEYLLIPRSPGNFKIPAVTFSYFDPRRNEYVSLTTDSYDILVEKGADDEIASGLGQRSQEGIRYLGTDIRHIKLNNDHLRPVGNFFFFSNLYFIILTASLLLFVLIFYHYRRNARLHQNQSLLRYRQATKIARKRLKTAHKYMHRKAQNEFYTEMSQALWGYISDKLNMPKADLSVESVKEVLSKRKAPDEIVEAFVATLNNCEFARFAPGDASDKMEELYKQGIEVITKTERIIK